MRCNDNPSYIGGVAQRSPARAVIHETVIFSFT